MPVNADGAKLPLQRGRVQTGAQPPFLLRYSPSFFALPDSAPQWFEHDAATNRLSLKDDVEIEPWIRPPHSKHTEAEKTWLYCADCESHLFKGRYHLPFRDRASQCMMKPQRRRTQQSGPSAAMEGGSGVGRGVVVRAQGIT